MPTDGPSAGSQTVPPVPPVSEEQVQEYAKQLRSAPAEQLVSELLSGLLNAAQVKLGRRDARLLIDLSAAVVDHARPHLPGDLTRQVDQILGQLRLGQVQAENAAAGAKPEPNDLAETPRPPAATAAAEAQTSQAPTSQAPTSQAPRASASGPSPTSRLWIPGRDF